MPVTARDFAVEVTEKLQGAGFQALWAGGCVRDRLMGRDPKDYDVATDATPEQIRELFGRKKTISMGAAFGVITVLGPRSAGQIEVATFRQDAAYSDGRHPDSVEFSTPEMDAQRRDFTINGLFYDPLRDKVIDFVDGQRDLQRKVVRAIGDPHDRIREDKLRMLRAVRFAACFDFHLDSETAEAIRENAPDLVIVSAERIAVELEKMLTHSRRGRAVRLLIETDLLTEIFPEAKNVADDSAVRERVLDHLKAVSAPNFAVALTVLLRHSVDPSRFGRACRRLRLSNEVRETGQWILKVYPTLRKAHDLPWSTVQPVLVDPRIEQALACLAADPDGWDSAITFCRQRLAWPPERLNPEPLLGGNQLRQHGFQPGPRFKRILQQVRDAQLDGFIRTPEEAIELAREIVQSDTESD